MLNLFQINRIILSILMAEIIYSIFELSLSVTFQCNLYHLELLSFLDKISDIKSKLSTWQSKIGHFS